MQYRFHSSICWLRRLQRRLAGFDAAFQMEWEFRTAEQGNIALTGEIDLLENDEFTIAVAFVEVIRARPRSCSNRWPSRLSHIASVCSAMATSGCES